MASETLHEKNLSEPTQDLHRAISSLMEELEAVDWYQQRVEATSDQELAAILAHNRDEEIEHAMMVLEWIRRRVPAFADHAQTYLFSKGPITEVEHAAKGGAAAHEPSKPAKPERPRDGSLGIGTLKKTDGGPR